MSLNSAVVESYIATALLATASQLSKWPVGALPLERDMEKAFSEALARELRNEAACDTQRPIPLDDWPNAGKTDVALLEADTTVVAVLELKWWGPNTSARNESLWDACKVATLVRQDKAAAGYLVSGGESRIWSRDDAMTRLFDDGTHKTSDLVSKSTSFWSSPANDETRVPASLRTTHIARTSCKIGKLEYEMRCVRSDPAGGDLHVMDAVRRNVFMTSEASDGLVCPLCGGNTVLPIVWGLPTAEAEQAAQRGRVVLGGCIVFGDERDSAWECQQCRERWGNAWQRADGDERGEMLEKQNPERL